ncbi:hypothetical protein CY35_03G085600 [Sphagnum magellanicum]|nr:hypothetical protein CY35_03G085600 [Sphagnum magellanicum]KAH9568596.1 hypothetical protein CY35_03G085600 [Sphagnum magellanicum]
MMLNQWREQAGGFFSSSSMKLKQATAVAGEVAKSAGSSVADAAEQAGSVMRSSWSLLQQEHGSNKDDGRPTIHDHWQSASSAFKKTREKVIAKKATVQSKALIAKMDWWQKGTHEEAVFGLPLDVLVEKQNSARPIPVIVIRCVDYLVKSGLHAEYLFRKEGDPLVLHHLVSLYHEDWNAALPDGVSPIDVAALLKLYLCMLPAPLLTFELYDDIVDARGSDHLLCQYLATLPAANYSTIECICALLLRISQKSALNKMDAHSLAIELSPALLWRKSKLSPPQSPKRDSEPKQAVHAMSLRRFSGTTSQGVTHEKGSPPLKQSNISVHVTVQGDADDNWQDLQDNTLLNGETEDEKSTEQQLFVIGAEMTCDCRTLLVR